MFIDESRSSGDNTIQQIQAQGSEAQQTLRRSQRDENRRRKQASLQKLKKNYNFNEGRDSSLVTPAYPPDWGLNLVLSTNFEVQSYMAMLIPSVRSCVVLGCTSFHSVSFGLKEDLLGTY